MPDSAATTDELVFLPLGGCGEIGMNLNAYGYGPAHSRRWIIVDVGVTFGVAARPPGLDGGLDRMQRRVSDRRQQLVVDDLSPGCSDCDRCLVRRDRPGTDRSCEFVGPCHRFAQFGRGPVAARGGARFLRQPFGGVTRARADERSRCISREREPTDLCVDPRLRELQPAQLAAQHRRVTVIGGHLRQHISGHRGGSDGIDEVHTHQDIERMFDCQVFGRKFFQEFFTSWCPMRRGAVKRLDRSYFRHGHEPPRTAVALDDGR